MAQKDQLTGAEARQGQSKAGPSQSSVEAYRRFSAHHYRGNGAFGRLDEFFETFFSLPTTSVKPFVSN
jgi:hypothetical protein